MVIVVVVVRGMAGAARKITRIAREMVYVGVGNGRRVEPTGIGVNGEVLSPGGVIRHVMG